jgi:hypothetical protein
MRTLQTSLSLRDGRAASLLNSKACGVAETGVVVYIVQEEKDVVRVCKLRQVLLGIKEGIAVVTQEQ